MITIKMNLEMIGKKSLWIASSLFLISSPFLNGDESTFFESKVRPLLIERCHECHSHKAKKLKANLFLDSRSGVLEGGDSGPIVKIDDLKSSLILEAVRYRNPNLQMPPKSKLSKLELETIEKWVASGAPWPDEPEPKAKAKRKKFDIAGRKASHWSWKPVVKPPLPPVKDESWGTQPIDRFILSRLEEAELKPAPQADKRSLIRRVTFDLHGLPPSPGEVNSFVEDDSPKAFEKVVDRLLSSPEFGEKWARHWMDLFRYAESRGHEFDYNTPNAYRYRDYLIRALNTDLPYDQFVTEHVAGDLLEEPRLDPETGANESILATGFWFLGEWIHSPVDTRQDEADRFDNMLGVFSKSFLGLTIDCARCHDHKFDAISSQDYYAMQGYLQSSGYRQARYETMHHNGRIARELDELEQSSELGKKLSKALVDGSADTAKYLLVAGRILRGELNVEKDLLKETGTPSPDSPIVFADFEDGTYGKWLTTGTAFGKGPLTLETKAEYQKDVRPHGKFFVNSHNVRKDPENANNRLGDDQLGTLTSPRFRIERDFITFLIGGGAFKRETCVNLLVNGKTVLSSTGRSSNTMFESRWDVRKWKGSEARIQIVDKRKGGWGNIGLDQVVFTNEKPSGNKDALAAFAFDDTLVTLVARAEKLNENRLFAWTESLASAKANKTDVLAPVAAIFATKNPNWKSLLSKQSETEERRKRYQDALKRLKIVADYGNLSPGGFMQDGLTFGQRPKLPGDFLLDSNGELAGVARWGMARREPVWKGLRSVDSAKDSGRGLAFERAGVTLRTPTFENATADAHYLIRGKAKAFAVVNSHRMVNGPLHGNVSMDIGRPFAHWGQGSDLLWVTQDLNKRGQTYLGHRLHIEFTPAENSDFEILMIDTSNESTARNEVLGYLTNPPNALLAGTEALGEKPTRENLASLLEKNLLSLAKDFEKGFGSRPDSIEKARVADWLVRHKNAFGLEEANADKKFLVRYKDLAGRIKRESRTAMAMLDGSSENEYVFMRGNHRNKGEVVPRRFIEALGGLDKPTPPEGSGRLALAKQVVDFDTNPFVTRVLVNRLWHHLFGRGIVPTTDDFGFLGRRPSHPDLLDYLATRLMEKEWSVKKMIKEIVMSRTYRMSSQAMGLGEDRDPANLLWHRADLRRLQAESIRDALLFVSGRLDKKMYGPPVPTYLTEFMQGRGRPGKGPLDGKGRRSIYLSVRRNFLSPFMLAFDTPSPFNAVGRRTSSNVPSQALILMNDPFVAGQAELWGKKLLKEFGDKNDRVRSLYETAFSRPPTEFELKASLTFVGNQAILHKVSEDHELPWRDLAHAIVNAKEFIFLN